MKRLLQSFLERKTLTVARGLLGKYLVREINGEIIREKITETEAYIGPHDLACHSAKGRTARTEVMHMEAGTIYVYFTYGMHWMLNIVTEEKNFPAAVLIRATENISGPARLTKKFQIDKSLNGKKLGKKSGLWIESDLKIENSPPAGPGRAGKLKIARTARIGVTYAGNIWSQKPYRFVIKTKI